MSGDLRSDVVAEEHVRALSDQLTAAGADECLLCYLNRLIAKFGCDGTLRWSARWRQAQPRSMPALLRRLERQGGFCDCEVIMNVFRYDGATGPGVRPGRCHLRA